MSVRIHKVQIGETIVSIAEHYNFRSWETLAELQENAELIALRGSAHAILAGDDLAIPEPSVGRVELRPGEERTFAAKSSPSVLVIRVFTGFYRIREDLPEDESPVPGRKSQARRGWVRGGTVPDHPVVEATVELSGPSGETRNATTDRRGRVWVTALTDGEWTLDVTPIDDELSPGPAGPNKEVDHGKDWTKGTKPGQRSISRSKKRKDRSDFDIEYRPLSVTLTVTDGAIAASRFNTPAATDRPHHAMLFWEDVTTDKHDARHSKKEKDHVTQVLEIDLKADFLRRLHEPAKTFTAKHPTRPIAVDRGGKSIELFEIHHTAGPQLSGALVDMTNRSVTNRKKVKVVQFKGVHFVNDRDGHVIRMVDDHYSTRHGGGSAKFSPAWRGKGTINDRSIGVENVQGGEAEFTAAQVRSLMSLVRAAISVYGIAPHDVIGHGDVFSGKATICPGPKFPWTQLEDEGLALKPDLIDAKADPDALEARRKKMFGGLLLGRGS